MNQHIAPDQTLSLNAVTGLESVQTGTIIRARLPSLAEDGTLHMYPRTCLVLGLEGAIGGDTVTGLLLSRLSFIADRFELQSGPVIEANALNQMGIAGLGARRDMQMRTERADLIPVDPYFLGDRIHVMGFINDRETVLTLGDALLDGMRSERGEASRGPRPRLDGAEFRQTPQSGMRPVFDKFPLAKIGRMMTLLKRVGGDDYERAFLQADLQNRQAAAMIARAMPAITPDDAVETTSSPALRTVYYRRGDVRRGKRKFWNIERVDQLVSRLNAGIRANREALGLEQPRDPGHVTSARIDALNMSATPRATRAAYERIEPRAMFSIAGEYSPVLPKNIRRGDVLVVKLADIMDPRDTRPAQRPCVVWNVYEDAEGNIAGFDLFPRTRLRAHQFDNDYTAEFPNLYNNRIWDGGRIIAQKIARLPVTAQYFHPVTSRVRNLNPELLAEVTAKREACEQGNAAMPTFGLAELPAGWTLRAQTQTPATIAQQAHAAHIFDRRERHRPALEKAPDVGDIIMRKVVRGGEIVETPTLIWGVWRNKVTRMPAAFDCVRLDDGENVARAWSVALDDDGTVADMTAIDLVYNTEKFFTPGPEAMRVNRVDDVTMERLDHRRASVLVQCADRKGSYPEFLPFDWERVAGPSYGFALDSLRSRKFAPDLQACVEPGYLRQNRARENNRRGMTPRSKTTRFTPK